MKKLETGIQSRISPSLGRAGVGLKTKTEKTAYGLVNLYYGARVQKSNRRILYFSVTFYIKKTC